jgi:mono/diheme cytochrome c family protein
VTARQLLVPLLAGLWACGSAALPMPTAADASRGSAHFPGLTLNELHQGRSLYLSRCGSCHVLKRPVELPPEQWQVEVDEMRVKNGVKLTDDEAQAIVRYLSVAASAG